jgi:hypothetical protein
LPGEDKKKNNTHFGFFEIVVLCGEIGDWSYEMKMKMNL